MLHCGNKSEGAGRSGRQATWSQPDNWDAGEFDRVS